MPIKADQNPQSSHLIFVSTPKQSNKPKPNSNPLFSSSTTATTNQAHSHVNKQANDTQRGFFSAQINCTTTSSDRINRRRNHALTPWTRTRLSPSALLRLAASALRDRHQWTRLANRQIANNVSRRRRWHRRNKVRKKLEQKQRRAKTRKQGNLCLLGRISQGKPIADLQRKELEDRRGTGKGKSENQRGMQHFSSHHHIPHRPLHSPVGRNRLRGLLHILPQAGRR